MQNKKLTLGIFAHANAGKTTVTEYFLNYSGMTRKVGRVDHGNTCTDSLKVEQQRGISVRAAVVSFPWKDTTIQLIDTPGHIDFVAEVERSLQVLDGAILVISAVEGIEAQTHIIWNALKRRQIPTLIFINKTDRVGADIHSIYQDIKATFDTTPILMNTCEDKKLIPTSSESQAETVSYVDDAILKMLLEDKTPDRETLDTHIQVHVKDATITPIFCGSALHNVGVHELLDGVATYLPTSSVSSKDELSALVFKVQHTEGKRNLWVKVYSGQLQVRERIKPIDKEEGQATALLACHGPKLVTTSKLQAGDIGVLQGLKHVQCGDILGKSNGIPPISPIAVPLLGMQVVPNDLSQWNDVLQALHELDDEDPHLQVRWDQTRREIHINLMGPLQAETLATMLQERYDLAIQFENPTTLYKEVPVGCGKGCASVTRRSGVELTIEPDPTVDGIAFESKYAVDWLYGRYQRQIERLVLTTLNQGLHGFELIGARVILTGGWCDSVCSDPSHYNLGTPLAFIRALKQATTELHEPMLRFQCQIDEQAVGGCLSQLTARRAEFSLEDHKGAVKITGYIPAAEATNMSTIIARMTKGKGVWLTEMSHYQRAPEGTEASRAWIGPDPRNENAYIGIMKNVIK